MFNLMVMPASPALAVELSAHDAASRALLAAARTLAVEAAAAGISAGIPPIPVAYGPGVRPRT